MSRYCHIAASPNTQAERERIDNAARAADQVFYGRQNRREIMDDGTAQAKARSMGLVARRSHTCKRTKTGRATQIGVICELWKQREPVNIAGMVLRSLEDGVYGKTWEQAFRRRAIRDVDQRMAKERAP